MRGTLGGEITVVGIRRRGVPLAERLAAALGELPRTSTSLQEVSLKRYADDLTLLHAEPRVESEPSLDLAGGTVLLVDDVLYSGRTLLRAVELALEAGAARVSCAVLCQRGVPEVPISAEFVGLRLDVSGDGIVEVRVPPYEPELEVVVNLRGRS